MARRIYAEINLHITWHTKDNLRMITPAIEPVLYRYITNKVINTPDAIFHAIGGTDDHVHLAASVRPTVDIDNWIGKLKGSSSHELGKALHWQSGYGVVSFGTRDLKWIVAYIQNQKEHHRSGSVFDRLERITEDER